MMKLKKSTGSKVVEAGEEIADKFSRNERSKTRIAGMVLGAVVTLGAIVYAITTLMAEEEME